MKLVQAGLAAFDARESYKKGDYWMLLSHGAEVVADVWAALDPSLSGQVLDKGDMIITYAAESYELRSLLHEQQVMQQQEATLQVQLNVWRACRPTCPHRSYSTGRPRMNP